MSDIDDDFESQEANESESYRDDKSPGFKQRQRDYEEWKAHFNCMSRPDCAKWMATRIKLKLPGVPDVKGFNPDYCELAAIYLEPDPDAAEYVAPIPPTQKQIRDAEERACVALWESNKRYDKNYTLEQAREQHKRDVEFEWEQMDGRGGPGDEDPSLTYAQFERFCEPMRRRYYGTARSKDHHRGCTLDEIEAADDGAPSYLLADAIPMGQITIGFGKFKAGKSRWFHKLALCVASGIPFDGEPVPHGRVLYVSLDPGARRKDVGRRLVEVRNRLGADPGDNFVLVDTPVYLDDPQSVASLLHKHPGPFELVVIDSMYRAVKPPGDLAGTGVMTSALDGAQEIADVTGATVCIAQHPPRGDQSHPYGSIFQEAACSSLIHFVADERTNVLTVRVELMKNGAPREAPFRYRREGSFLESLDVIPQGAPAALAIATAPHQDKLELMPTKRTSVREARKLIEHLLTGTPRAREQTWLRARTAWAAAGLIEQRNGMIRRAVA